MITQVAMERYRQFTPQSYAWFQEGQSLTPGGVKGNVLHFDPYPLTLKHAQGAWVTDVDERRYVDYLLSYGPLAMGHGHPKIKEAIQYVWDSYGTSVFGTSCTAQLTFIRQLQRLYPSMEQMRFSNSGTEATQTAIRLGMAYTGKPCLAKFNGHYHGGHEHALVNMRPSDVLSGDPQPASLATSYGLPQYFLDHTLVLPFNDLPACEKLLREWKDRVGTVILEPLQGNFIPADPAFITGVRELTDELGMVLIFDEVKTGMRTTLGGAQEYYGVKPDLTTLGKVVGGGFPIGVFGGKKEVMELLNPSRSNGFVFHSGTFSANPMSIWAGITTMEYLEDGHFDATVIAANRLRADLPLLASSYGFRVKTAGIGTTFNVLFVPENQTEEEERLYRQDTELRYAWDYLLLCHGVFLKPGYIFNLSSCHGDEELQHTINAMEKAFAELKTLR